MEKSYYEKVCETMSIYGMDQANLPELFAILIGKKSSSEVCNKLSFLPLRDLLQMSKEDFESFEGIGSVTAKRLEAMFQLFKRFSQRYLYDNRLVSIKCPDDMYSVVKHLRYENQEHFVALFLNTKNQVIGQKTIFIGTLNGTVVHPREILREAIKYSSASIAIAHNHPSGDSTPSSEDIAFTNRLNEASSLVGIELIDHLIVGDNQYTSLKKMGYL